MVSMSLNLNRSLAPIYSPEEARFKTFQKSFIKNASQLLHDEKLKDSIPKIHSSFFPADNPTYQTGLPQLHAEDVLNE